LLSFRGLALLNISLLGAVVVVAHRLVVAVVLGVIFLELLWCPRKPMQSRLALVALVVIHQAHQEAITDRTAATARSTVSLLMAAVAAFPPTQIHIHPAT
jgi:hypothetical protein